MVISIRKVIWLSIDDTKNYFNFIWTKKSIYTQFGKPKIQVGLEINWCPVRYIHGLGPLKNQLYKLSQ